MWFVQSLYTRIVLKIISGDYRSRVLLTPAGEDRTRPMTARVKESLFAMLHGGFKGARVLDLATSSTM